MYACDNHCNFDYLLASISLFFFVLPMHTLLPNCITSCVKFHFKNNLIIFEHKRSSKRKA